RRLQCDGTWSRRTLRDGQRDRADAFELRVNRGALRRLQRRDQAARRDDLAGAKAAEAHHALTKAGDDRRERVVLRMAAQLVVHRCAVYRHPTAQPRKVERAEIAQRISDHVAIVADVVGKYEKKRRIVGARNTGMRRFTAMKN